MQGGALQTEMRLAAATRGTYVAFLGSGFGTASWAARIPQVRVHFHLAPASLGLLLLASAVVVFRVASVKWT